MKKITIIAFILLALFFVSSQALAVEEVSEELVIIHFFNDRLSPVCQETKNFIESMLEDYPQAELRIYPIHEVERLHQMAKDHGVEDYRTMAPTIFIGENFFQFRDFTSREQEMVLKAIEGETLKEPLIVSVIGSEINIEDKPLFVRAFSLGFLDGFNAHSIIALLLVLFIIIVIDSKKKIFFYGGLFIVISALLYGLFVFVWGGAVHILMSQAGILRIIMGLAILAGAIYFAKEFWRFFKYDSRASESTPMKKALVFIIVSFAVVATLIELPCSVALPISFGAMLVGEGISPITYFFYIFIYLFSYVFIEIIILTVAILTKKNWFRLKLITWVYFFAALFLLYLSFRHLFL